MSARARHPAVQLGWAWFYTLRMCRRCAAQYRRDGDAETARRTIAEWGDTMGRKLGLEVESTGASAIDWSKPVIVMANHQSWLDIWALYQTLPRPYGMVAKKELARIPFFGGMMEVVGCVLIDRRNNPSAIDALSDAAEQVRGGRSIVIFPEGTRSHGPWIAPFKKGSFHLAQAARVPIVPAGIVGSAALMPRSNTGIRPGRVEVHFGTPVEPVDKGGRLGRAALADAVRSELSRLSGLPLG